MVTPTIEPKALILTAPVECVASAGEQWIALLAGVLFGLFIYAVIDAMVFSLARGRR